MLLFGAVYSALFGHHQPCVHEPGLVPCPHSKGIVTEANPLGHFPVISFKIYRCFSNPPFPPLPARLADQDLMLHLGRPSQSTVKPCIGACLGDACYDSLCQ